MTPIDPFRRNYEKQPQPRCRLGFALRLIMDLSGLIISALLGIAVMRALFQIFVHPILD
ncbi:MAG: hypothetical protein WA840_12625 [Caulobacteraceae bacterium]